MKLKNDNCKDCGKSRSEMKELPWTRKLNDGSWGIQCKKCRITEVENKINEFQEKEIDTEYCDNIICPHCGNEHESDCENPIFYNDGEHVFQCRYCDNEFNVITDISFSYTTEIIK